ncbi:MAG: hypothetical protein KJO49_03325 [Bacteroidia bacterium]|nr:hypothetical protein [Bacteroidia bacterium]MBT8268062.1 hypothetical protein [Bacteroidia bacterium]NNF82079.1 hypothetical protein [Flavobacteriaceae bacterium]NNK68966.1 hypothetical protein [Flavobacteriaceae bacterium]NNL81283.1 hypothetical protein [Flavobacteriaceae bacterium]
MRRLIGIILVSSLVLSACKNEAKEPENTEPVIEESAPKKLVVNFKFKTDKYDTFRIMLDNVEVDDLQKKNIHIFENVMPSSGTDEISAVFDEGNISNILKVSLGNKETKEVELVGFSLTYGEKHREWSTASDYNKFLIFNKFIQRDTSSLILKTQRVEGKLNPVIVVKRPVLNELMTE